MVNGSKAVAKKGMRGMTASPISDYSKNNSKTDISKKNDNNNKVRDGVLSGAIPKVSETETLQREKLMRLRKQNSDGCGSIEVIETVTKPVAKNDRTVSKMGSVPLGKVLVMQAQQIRAVQQQQQAAAAKKVDTKCGDTIVVNGRASDTKSSSPSKPKIAVDFEDDSDDSENENLQKVMAEIDNELMTSDDEHGNGVGTADKISSSCSSSANEEDGVGKKRKRQRGDRPLSNMKKPRNNEKIVTSQLRNGNISDGEQAVKTKADDVGGDSKEEDPAKLLLQLLVEDDTSSKTLSGGGDNAADSASKNGNEGADEDETESVLEIVRVLEKNKSEREVRTIDALLYENERLIQTLEEVGGGIRSSMMSYVAMREKKKAMSSAERVRRWRARRKAAAVGATAAAMVDLEELDEETLEDIASASLTMLSETDDDDVCKDKQDVIANVASEKSSQTADAASELDDECAATQLSVNETDSSVIMIDDINADEESNNDNASRSATTKRKLGSVQRNGSQEETPSVAAVTKAPRLDDETQCKNVVTMSQAVVNNKENVCTTTSSNKEDDNGGRSNKDVVYRLSKNDLEMLIINRVSEYFTDSNKSDIGALRRRCEQLEKALEQWRRRANICQKELLDLQIVFQRAQLNKKVLVQPMRPAVRSVGLQVQLTRYIPGQNIIGQKVLNTINSFRPGQNLTVTSSKPGSSPNLMATSQGTKIAIPKQSSGLAFSLGSAGSLGGTFVSAKPASGSGVASSTSSRRSSLSSATSSSMTVTARTVLGKVPSTSVGISLLQPRTSMPTTLVFSAPIVTTTTSTTVNANSNSALRPLLENKSVTLTPTATPVPMRLVPNQAARQTNTSTTATVTVTPAKASFVGQTQVASVKFVDLTTDEEEHNRSVAFGLSSTTSSLTIVPAALNNTSNAVTVLTPSAASNQILTINPSMVVSGGSRNVSPLRMTTSAVHAASGTAAAPIVTAAPVRLAYLVPSTSVVTMVRPNQSLFVASTGVQRPSQSGGVASRPTVPTIVLQRGTTLVPLQQAPLQTVRSASIINGVRPRPLLLPPIVPSIRQVSTSTTSTTIPNSSNTSQATVTITTAGVTFVTPSGQSILTQAKTCISSVSFQHPAPLPPQPSYPDSLSSGRKVIPPKPALKISKVTDGIVLSWNMSITSKHAEVSSYQLYAYQESENPPNTKLWKKVGEVKALPLPMACTLTQFVEGHKYYFAVRAVDVHNRLGAFSEAGGITLAAGSSTKQTTEKSTS